MVQFIRLRGDFWVGAGFISDHRTASQLLSQREAARMVKNFVQPIILALAYGTCASAKISCHSAGPGGPGACGRPPKDPAKKAAEAEQKRRDAHKKATKRRAFSN